METRYGTWLPALAAAALFACGGSQQETNAFKQQVNVETSNLAIADAATISLDASLKGAAVIANAALTYSGSTGKYSGAFFLAPNAPGEHYDLTLTARNAAGSVIGSATGQATVSPNTVANVTINVASTLAAAPTAGFAISGFAATGYVDVGVAAPFSVTVIAPAGAPAPTYKWTRSTGCNGTFAPNDTSASITFTDTTPQVCTLTVTVTDSVNPNLKASKSAQIGVGVTVSIGGTFIPSPTITQAVLIGNGGVSGVAEPPCTVTRAGSTATSAETCPAVYRLNAAVGQNGAPGATTFAIGVLYDLGGMYDAAKAPTVGVTARCPGSATNGVSLYSFDNVPANPIAGSGPGAASCPAAPAVCIGSTTLWWTEPTAFAGAATGDLCTLTLTVNNQGALDSLQVFLALTQ